MSLVLRTPTHKASSVFYADKWIFSTCTVDPVQKSEFTATLTGHYIDAVHGGLNIGPVQQPITALCTGK